MYLTFYFQVEDPELMLRAINAAAAVVNEEKKSLNSQPAISKLFEIATQKPVIEFHQIETRAKVFDHPLEQIQISAF